jgi:hypothetical protein
MICENMQLRYCWYANSRIRAAAPVEGRVLQDAGHPARIRLLEFLPGREYAVAVRTEGSSGVYSLTSPDVAELQQRVGGRS